MLRIGYLAVVLATALIISTGSVSALLLFLETFILPVRHYGGGPGHQSLMIEVTVFFFKPISHLGTVLHSFDALWLLSQRMWPVCRQGAVTAGA